MFIFATGKELFPSWFDVIIANRILHKTEVGVDHSVVLGIDNSDRVLVIRRKTADLTPVTLLLLFVEDLPSS